MTDDQLTALITILNTYVDINDVKRDWDHEVICGALQLLFEEKVLTPEELSLEIQTELNTFISPDTLRKASEGRLIRMIPGGLNTRIELPIK